MLSIHRSTVAKYLKMDHPPQSVEVRLLLPLCGIIFFAGQKRCHSPKQLWLEVKEKGVSGGLGSVYCFLIHLGMKPDDHALALKPHRLSAKKASWILVAPDEKLDDY